MNTPSRPKARFASLEKLIAELLPAYLDPTPCKSALRAWFAREGVPTVKANPNAHRGGGVVFYSVAAVEKLLNGGAK